jgi:hypothetical protein
MTARLANAHREPYDEYVRELTAQVLAGKEDQQLVYRRRLRRKLDEYERKVPPSPCRRPARPDLRGPIHSVSGHHSLERVAVAKPLSTFP